MKDARVLQQQLCLCPHVQASKAAQALSMEINSKRQRRGLKARAVRAVVIGFPNVGKSALINRFLGKRLCDSAPKPGVTKHLRWLRIGADLDMLDAPGVAALPVLGLCAVLGLSSQAFWSAWTETASGRHVFHVRGFCQVLVVQSC